MNVDAVLIFRLGSLGDTIVALPCFHAIEKAFPTARRILITDATKSSSIAPVEAVIGGSGLIHETIYLTPKLRSPLSMWSLRNIVASTGAKRLVYIANRNILSTIRDEIFFRTCGVTEFVGTSIREDVRGLRLDATSFESEPECARLARTIQSLGIVDLEDPSFWDLRLQPDEIETAATKLAPLGDQSFIAVASSAKVAAKDWGESNWRRLITNLATDFAGYGLVFVGVANEAARAARLGERWRGSVLNLCGELTARELAAALAPARLFIGHDSGPLHLAAAMGVRCLGIYGNYNSPRRWHPYGRAHLVIHEQVPVGEISETKVANAARTLLDRAWALNESSFSHSEFYSTHGAADCTEN